VTFELIEFGALSAFDRAQLEGGETDPFDAAGISLAFRPKDRHVALRDRDGRLAASAGLVETQIEGAGRRIDVVGLGGVIVRADRRREGLGRRIVEAALARARALGPPFALLFCHEDRAGLYERLGFFRVRAPVEVAQRSGWAPMPLPAMALALSSEVPWPEGPIRLHSLPF
jgi:predicted N-acetyltransferase YhbS